MTLYRPLIWLLLLTSPCSFAEPQGQAQQEILHLMDFVKQSSCEFERNGKRYNAPKALEHIQKKYDHFIDEIQSAEDFVRLSATKSEMSGSSYHIYCPEQASQTSAEWLLTELMHWRQQAQQ